MKKWILIFAAFLAAGRVVMGFTVPVEAFSWLQAYKDVAHLFMGGLFVSWWYDREPVDKLATDWCEAALMWLFNQPWQFWLFWAMNAVEVTVAVMSRV